MSQQNATTCPRCGYPREKDGVFCGNCQLQFTHYGHDSSTILRSPITPIVDQSGLVNTIPATYPVSQTPKKRNVALIVLLSVLSTLLVGGFIAGTLFIGINMGKVNPRGTPSVTVGNNTPIVGGNPVDNVTPTASLPSPTTVSTVAPPQVFSTKVVVQANQPWRDSGVNIPEGKNISIRYVSGLWNSQTGAFADFDAAGQPNGYKCTYYFPAAQCTEAVPDAIKGSLVGKIGTEVLKIGDALNFTASQGGSLLLRMNDADNGLYDNQGSITVEIEVS